MIRDRFVLVAVLGLIFACTLLACSERVDGRAGSSGETSSSAVTADYTVDDLLSAAGDGDLELVQAVVKAGVDVNSTDDYGITALMQSVSGGHVDLVKYLLEAGADAKAHDADGYSALLHTVEQHGEVAGDAELSAFYWEIMRLLVKAGCDINGASSDGETPLSLARGYQDSEDGKTVKLLIELGAKQ